MFLSPPIQIWSTVSENIFKSLFHWRETVCLCFLNTVWSDLEASFSFSFLNLSSAVSVQHKGREQKCPLHLKSTNFSTLSLQSAVYSGSDSELREMLACWSRRRLKYEREKGRRRMTFHTAHRLNRLETLSLILGQSITGCDIMNGLKSEGNNEKGKGKLYFLYLV